MNSVSGKGGGGVGEGGGHQGPQSPLLDMLPTSSKQGAPQLIINLIFILIRITPVHFVIWYDFNIY
jgi:hypothetical protein